jgi:hypothetical protein
MSEYPKNDGGMFWNAGTYLLTKITRQHIPDANYLNIRYTKIQI